MSATGPTALQVCGWREWVALPELGIVRLKAKVDTGARTSALHAFRLDTTWERGALHVRFAIRPRRPGSAVVDCIAAVRDRRRVRDSGGHVEMRYVIVSPVRLGAAQWPIELTLTDRDDMRFRMLLGRTALVGRYRIDPAQSYLMGRSALAPGCAPATPADATLTDTTLMDTTGAATTRMATTRMATTRMDGCETDGNHDG